MLADFSGSTGLRGHTANWAKFNAYISYFGTKTRSRATEVGYVFPHGRGQAGFEPRTLRFQDFLRGGLGMSGFRRIHWATGSHVYNMQSITSTSIAQ